MTNKSVSIRVLMPGRVVYEGSADMVVMRSVEGDRGIMPGHIPCTLALGFGLLRIYQGKKLLDTLAVMGGMATVQEDCITVVSEMADHPDKIGEVELRKAGERALRKHRERMAETEITYARKVLRRSLIERNASSYAILKGRDHQEL